MWRGLSALRFGPRTLGASMSASAASCSSGSPAWARAEDSASPGIEDSSVLEKDRAFLRQVLNLPLVLEPVLSKDRYSASGAPRLSNSSICARRRVAKSSGGGELVAGGRGGRGGCRPWPAVGKDSPTR